GAGALRRFWTITVPGVKGAMFLVSAMVTVAAMRVFTELYVLSEGSGGPGGDAMSLGMLVQQTGSGVQGRLGCSCALRVALFVVSTGPLLLGADLNSRGDPAIAKEVACAPTSGRAPRRRPRPRRGAVPPRWPAAVSARTARRGRAASASPSSPV